MIHLMGPVQEHYAGPLLGLTLGALPIRQTTGAGRLFLNHGVMRQNRQNGLLPIIYLLLRQAALSPGL